MSEDLYDVKMLEMLVCPVTGGRLSISRDHKELICYSAGLAYPIRSGVPIMLTSEARPLEESERAAFKTTSKAR